MEELLLFIFGTTVRSASAFTNDLIIEPPLDAFIFKRAASFNRNDQVQNVIPGDFTHDGTLDLLVMTNGASPAEVSMQLYVGSPGNGFGTLPTSQSMMLCSGSSRT